MGEGRPIHPQDIPKENGATGFGSSTVVNPAIPCPIPYQGSKRRLASQIVAWLPSGQCSTFYEPFAGSGAMSLAAAKAKKAQNYIISDILEPLAKIWSAILDDPNRLASNYDALWTEQLDNPRATYNRIRDEFNVDGDPAKLLYLIARCVKNAVRFNPSGLFNQSPDNRRLGMRPDKMRREIREAHFLLSGRTTVLAVDYREALQSVNPDDVVYMDPPYQGVSTGRDKRYIRPLELEAFIAELERLNRIEVPYLVSFDGMCGSRAYGEELPRELGLRRVLLDAGRSSQATLLGRDDITVESLYVSPALLRRCQSPIAHGGGQRVIQIAFSEE